MSGFERWIGRQLREWGLFLGVLVWIGVIPSTLTGWPITDQGWQQLVLMGVALLSLLPLSVALYFLAAARLAMTVMPVPDIGQARRFTYGVTGLLLVLAALPTPLAAWVLTITHHMTLYYPQEAGVGTLRNEALTYLVGFVVAAVVLRPVLAAWGRQHVLEQRRGQATG